MNTCCINKQTSKSRVFEIDRQHRIKLNRIHSSISFNPLLLIDTNSSCRGDAAKKKHFHSRNRSFKRLRTIEKIYWPSSWAKLPAIKISRIGRHGGNRDPNWLADTLVVVPTYRHSLRSKQGKPDNSIAYESRMPGPLARPDTLLFPPSPRKVISSNQRRIVWRRSGESDESEDWNGLWSTGDWWSAW